MFSSMNIKREISVSEMFGYVKVSESENGEQDPIELPIEEDGTLLLSTLTAQFTGASGLKYRSDDAKNVRGIRLSEERLHPPVGGWGSTNFFCVFPKVEKRQLSDDESEPENRKRLEKTRCSDLIVLNIPYTTTEEILRKYLDQQGDVLMCQLKKDPISGRSKGYGFVRFKKYEDQKRVLSKRHLIDGRWCEFRIPNSHNPACDSLPFKLFVGRITEKVTNNDILNYFKQFGEITEVFRPNPFRGFVFVSFVNADVVESLCGEDHLINGISVYVSNAAPKVKRPLNQASSSHSASGGGGGCGPVYGLSGMNMGSGGQAINHYFYDSYGSYNSNGVGHGNPYGSSSYPNRMHGSGGFRSYSSGGGSGGYNNYR